MNSSPENWGVLTRTDRHVQGRARAGNQQEGRAERRPSKSQGRPPGVFGKTGFRCGVKADSTEDSDGRFWNRVHKVKGLAGMTSVESRSPAGTALQT